MIEMNLIMRYNVRTNILISLLYIGRNSLLYFEAEEYKKGEDN